MRSLLVLAFCVAAFSGCARSSAAAKHYQLYGRIVSLDANDRVATIDTKAIPNWMEAMTMEYPVKSASEFAQLKVGESIKATLNVRGAGDYDLSEVQPQTPAAK